MLPSSLNRTVDATRREQAVQDVSAALSVVGADQLRSGQIHTLEDLQFLVPSITTMLRCTGGSGAHW
jgi:outer membrane receptor protein involved in Fe transport